ncbi:hypothetical protein DSO57_1032827 [Entomophthora muscae]|uniref:Uncharacterized protein n=1 Tax=Entomophthora muscae TaxID=34485 RepID=A0ACC2UAE5_9FUNG|nr:hypothetical protein DSO57_1032827 [Entomophthora muscae]
MSLSILFLVKLLAKSFSPLILNKFPSQIHDMLFSDWLRQAKPSKSPPINVSPWDLSTNPFRSEDCWDWSDPNPPRRNLTEVFY